MSAFKVSSGIQKVSRELIIDSRFNIADLLVSQLAKSVHKKVASLIISGGGTTEPVGWKTDVTTGATAADDASFTYPEVLTLWNSVEPYYGCDNGNAIFLGSSAARLQLLSLLDDNDRPLWSVGAYTGDITQPIPLNLLGHRFVTDYSMDAVAASNKPLLFGDMKEFMWIRLAGDVVFQTNESLYWANDQIGYRCSLRFDSKVINAKAAKCLTMAAS